MSEETGGKSLFRYEPPIRLIGGEESDSEFKLPDKFEDTKHSVAFNAKLNNLSKKTGFDAWTGNNSISALFNIYLLHKYKSHCYLHAKPYARQLGEPGLVFLIHQKSESDKEAQDDPYDKHNKFIVETLLDCIVRGVDTIIIPLTIAMKVTKTNEILNHANVLIYRKKFRTIEHFEPHGKYIINSKNISNKVNLKVDKSLIQPLNLLLEQKYKEGNQGKPHEIIHFISSEEICPDIGGVQTIESKYSSITRKEHEKGYCAAWSHFFTELALCNPNIPSKDLLEKLYGTFKNKVALADYFLSMIRGYTRMINAKILTFLDILYGKKLTAEGLYDNNVNFMKTFSVEIGWLVEMELLLLNNYEGDINLFIKNYLEEKLDHGGWRILNDKHNLDEDIIWKNIHGHTVTKPHIEVRMFNIARKLHRVMISKSMSPISNTSNSTRRSPPEKRRLSPSSSPSTRRSPPPQKRRLSSSPSSSTRRSPAKKKIMLA